MKDRPAFDDVIQGMSGIAALNGLGGEPSYVPMVIADKFVGHSLALTIAMALFHRERTGEGQEVHVPMYETMTAFNLVEHLWCGALGEPEKGLGYGRMLTPHRRPYATKDGYIVAMANTDEQYRRMFAVIERPDLIGDPRFERARERVQNIDLLYGIIREEMRKRTSKEWLSLLDAADIPNGPLNQLADVWSDPQLRETDFFQSLDHPSEGRIVTLGITSDFSRSPGAIRLPPPRLGEHTAEILEELGIAVPGD
jgi:crotonobetainyl-CoA:carnitine CoA-transferase CaiB-like acyl-CoA transferase